MHIKPFQAVFPELNLITSADSFFGTVKEEYPEYYESGFFNKSGQDALYIYQIEGATDVYTGVIACAAIEDYLEGHIRKHENTLAAKEQKQLQLLLRRQAAVKPVLLTYPVVPEIDEWTLAYAASHAPFLSFHFEEDEQTHRVWEIKKGKDIQYLQKLFAKTIPNTYIADGHHRTTTTALMYERVKGKADGGSFDQLLCAFFPSTEIQIHDFNRVVEGLEELPVSVFMAKLSQLFEMELLKEPAKPSKKHTIHMRLEKTWFKLQWRKSILEAFKKEVVLLDTMLLNELVLKKILGIKNVRDDLRIQYVEGPKGIRGVEKKTDRSPASIGFCLPPVQLEELIKLTDANKVLPPKSTWFEPRMKNGLIVKDY
jgi:uncharacterized protein (DUF1015 family)